MANNKVYGNYLMHGRTKGSRNGISTTKGYRAVGHKARGRLSPDGRYIYDMSTHKKYVTDGLGDTGMGGYTEYELDTKTAKKIAKKKGVDVNLVRKTINSINKGGRHPWQQKANAAQYKDLYRDASRSDTSRNTWQQNAKASEFRTRNVDVYDPTTDSYQSMDRNKVKEYNKTLIRKLEGTLPNTLGGAANQSSTKGTVTKPNTQAPQNNWQQQAIKNAAKGNLSNRVLNGETKAAKANNGTIYTAKELGFTSKTAQKKGAKNNWQQTANAQRAGTEAARKYYGKQSNQALYTGGKAYENAIDSVTQDEKARNFHKRVVAEDKAKKAADAGAKNNWQQQAADAQRKAEAKARWNAGNKAQTAKKAVAQAAEQGAKNNWQQQAAYQQQKDASKKKVKSVLERDSLSGKTHGHLNVDPSKSVVSNQWQRHGEEARTRKLYGDSSVGHKTFAQEQADTTKKHISQEKMKSKQPNAMQGDPRYTSKENAMKGDPRYSKSSTFKKSGIMQSDRIPYSSQMEKSTNMQELASAIAKNKQYINDMKTSALRNSRSDVGNAVADFKEEVKAKAKSLFKKKKKKKK